MRSRAYVYLSRLSTAATDASGFAAEHPIDVKKRSNKNFAMHFSLAEAVVVLG